MNTAEHTMMKQDWVAQAQPRGEPMRGEGIEDSGDCE